jgi:hypothetical protein
LVPAATRTRRVHADERELLGSQLVASAVQRFGLKDVR